MPTIHHRVERERGCGYRKEGGLYLVSGQASGFCGKLPFSLTVCHCCGQGIKFSRGFTWINSDLFKQIACSIEWKCSTCVMRMEDEPLGLMWVGEKFYKQPSDFTREGLTMGISKRIAVIPRRFKVGKTWIALAHIKAISVVNPDNSVTFTPGIFQLFRPTAIEYVVRGNESNDELDDMEKMGITLVTVTPEAKQTDLINN